MNIADPLIVRVARKFDRPTSWGTGARPMIATVIIILAPMIPYVFYFAVFIAAELWTFFALRHLSAMAARRFLATRTLVPADRLAEDKRLVRRTIVCMLISIVSLIIPVTGYVIFAIFHGDLNRLASRIPRTPVTYIDFQNSEIGPFQPNAVGRFPDHLEIGIGSPDVVLEADYPPRIRGIVFVLEDDNGSIYDNF